MGLGGVIFTAILKQSSITATVDDFFNGVFNGGNGVKNWSNNPLNIRGTFNDKTMWKGEVKSERNSSNYLGFKSPNYCFRAGYILLGNYNKLYGINSLRDIIYRYAPPSDNNHTDNYIKYVGGKMGLMGTDVISPNQYPQMLAYMSDFETGNHGEFSTNRVLGYLRGFDYDV